MKNEFRLDLSCTNEEFIKKNDGCLKLPNDVNFLCDKAFANLSCLTTVKMNSNLRSFGKGVFQNCNNLQKIEFSNKITTISAFAFAYCDRLESVELPFDVRSIEDHAFLACESLEKIKLPRRLMRIHEFAFEKCVALREIVIPESVREIEDAAFFRCSSLKSVKLQGSLTKIGKQAFEQCTSLEEIEIPDNVHTIDERAFYRTRLKEVIVSKNCLYAKNAFPDGCKILFKEDIATATKALDGIEPLKLAQSAIQEIRGGLDLFNNKLDEIERKLDDQKQIYAQKEVKKGLFSRDRDGK